jgi:hypothetical protein
MRILFLKSAPPEKPDEDDEKLSLPEKMVLILKEHARTAKTGDERDKAEKNLSKLKGVDSQPDAPKT